MSDSTSQLILFKVVYMDSRETQNKLKLEILVLKKDLFDSKKNQEKIQNNHLGLSRQVLEVPVQKLDKH